MIQLVFSPRWFYGKDILIDFFSIVILLMISLLAFRYYRINRRKKKHALLSLAFLVMALSFFFKILTNFTIYYKEIETKNLGFLTVTYSSIEHSHILFIVGFLLFRVFMLLGLLILYSIYEKNSSKKDVLILAYFIIISTYFGRSAYYLFHISTLPFLIIITNDYFVNYRKNKYPNSKRLAYSFAIITLSQVFFIFVELSPVIYVIAELIQLLGYALLFLTLIKVLKHGKKKGKT